MRYTFKIFTLSFLACFFLPLIPTYGKTNDGNKLLPIEVFVNPKNIKSTNEPTASSLLKSENKAIQLKIRSDEGNEGKVDLIIAATKEIQATEETTDRYSPEFNAEQLVLNGEEPTTLTSNLNGNTDWVTSRQDTSPFTPLSNNGDSFNFLALQQALQTPQPLILNPGNEFSPLQNLRNFEHNLQRELLRHAGNPAGVSERGRNEDIPLGMMISTSVYPNDYSSGLANQQRNFIDPRMLNLLQYGLNPHQIVNNQNFHPIGIHGQIPSIPNPPSVNFPIHNMPQEENQNFHEHPRTNRLQSNYPHPPFQQNRPMQNVYKEQIMQQNPKFDPRQNANHHALTNRPTEQSHLNHPTLPNIQDGRNHLNGQLHPPQIQYTNIQNNLPKANRYPDLGIPYSDPDVNNRQPHVGQRPNEQSFPQPYPQSNGQNFREQPMKHHQQMVDYPNNTPYHNLMRTNIRSQPETHSLRQSNNNLHHNPSKPHNNQLNQNIYDRPPASLGQGLPYLNQQEVNYQNNPDKKNSLLIRENKLNQPQPVYIPPSQIHRHIPQSADRLSQAPRQFTQSAHQSPEANRQIPQSAYLPPSEAHKQISSSPYYLPSGANREVPQSAYLPPSEAHRQISPPTYLPPSEVTRQVPSQSYLPRSEAHRQIHSSLNPSHGTYDTAKDMDFRNPTEDAMNTYNHRDEYREPSYTAQTLDSMNEEQESNNKPEEYLRLSPKKRRKYKIDEDYENKPPPKKAKLKKRKKGNYKQDLDENASHQYIIKIG